MRGVLLSLFVTSVLLAAPPPKARPVIKVEVSPVGNWVMFWSSSEWHAQFNKDGTYHCGRELGQMEWIGNWELKGKSLKVTEKHFENSTTLTWIVNLEEGKLKGKLKDWGFGEGIFYLEVLKPKKPDL